jgi:hypothetical protein
VVTQVNLPKTTNLTLFLGIVRQSEVRPDPRDSSVRLANTHHCLDSPPAHHSLATTLNTYSPVISTLFFSHTCIFPRVSAKNVVVLLSQNPGTRQVYITLTPHLPVTHATTKTVFGRHQENSASDLRAWLVALLPAPFQFGPWISTATARGGMV